MTTLLMTGTSQLERANKILFDLNSDVTTEDRRVAADQFGLSMRSVLVYLNGRGKKLDTAVNLIEFFKKRYSDRERFLSGE